MKYLLTIILSSIVIHISLAPMTASFYVIYHATGENLFTWEENGKSSKKALDYLSILKIL